jgi:hypothetical protein
MAELRLRGRAWTATAALDFEACVCGKWIDGHHQSILPEAIRRAVPAWASQLVSVQPDERFEARLTEYGRRCQARAAFDAIYASALVHYVTFDIIPGRALVRLLGNQGPPPGAVASDTTSGGVVGALRGIEQAIREGLASKATPQSGVAAPGETVKAAAENTKPRKAKRSTEQTDVETKLIAALTKHHQYADGGCLNLDAIGCRELARQAKVGLASAKRFFDKHFKGHKKYRNYVCADKGRLITALKLLNQEFSPCDSYGAKPPGEGERDD